MKGHPQQLDMRKADRHFWFLLYGAFGLEGDGVSRKGDRLSSW